MRLQDFGDFIVCLQVELQGLREITHITPINLECTDVLTIFFMQFRCYQEGIPSDLVVLGLLFDAFIFIGRQGELIVFLVDISDLFGHFVLQRMPGEAVAKSHQHRGGHLPILELDQGCGSVVFGGRPDF